MNDLDLTKIQGYLESSANFISEQSPLVVQELLMVGRLQCTIATVLLIIVSLVSGIVGYRAHKSNGFGYSDFDGLIAISWAVFASSSLMSVVMLFQCMIVWLAPRVYLLRQFSELI